MNNDWVDSTWVHSYPFSFAMPTVTGKRGGGGGYFPIGPTRKLPLSGAQQVAKIQPGSLRSTAPQRSKCNFFFPASNGVTASPPASKHLLLNFQIQQISREGEDASHSTGARKCSLSSKFHSSDCPGGLCPWNLGTRRRWWEVSAWKY